MEPTQTNVRMASCPACRQSLQTTELTCPGCGLQLRGRFERGCRFCALDPDQQHLLDVFLSCRGVLRDMEKALGVSYPTVRNRVDGLLSALGYAPPKAEAEPEAAPEDLGARRQEILHRLEAGEITPDEATAALKELSG